MNRQQIDDAYLNWMYRLVCGGKRARGLSYKKPFRFLNETEFTYILDMDANRANDGTDLRFRFADEREDKFTDISTWLFDNKPCSVLEMILALSIRCEEHIMNDPEIGNRTSEWFWSMLDSMRLTCMDDSEFDIKYVKRVVRRFVKREYEPNGQGGLFTIVNRVRGCEVDLRNVEIWYQMMWYLDSIT